LRLDTVGDQSLCDTACGTIEVGIAGRATAMDDCCGVGPLPGVLAHDVGEARNLDTHATFPQVLCGDFTVSFP
jgi:hypothetical protein